MPNNVNPMEAMQLQLQKEMRFHTHKNLDIHWLSLRKLSTYCLGQGYHGVGLFSVEYPRVLPVIRIT